MNINNPILYPNRYFEYYQRVICQDLILKKPYLCFMELPKLEKLLIHTTSKHYVQDEKNIFPSFLGLQIVSGQKPKLNYARKSISTFKLREKQVISCKIDLRNQNLYHFLEKLITIILPINRTFSGIKKQGFEKKETTSFPKILIDQNRTPIPPIALPTATQVYKTSFDKPTATQARVHPHFLGGKLYKGKDQRFRIKKAKCAGYHIGLQNLWSFPELETRYQFFEKDIGVDLSFIIRNSSFEEMILLLTAFQFPCEN